MAELAEEHLRREAELKDVSERRETQLKQDLKRREAELEAQHTATLQQLQQLQAAHEVTATHLGQSRDKITDLEQSSAEQKRKSSERIAALEAKQEEMAAALACSVQQVLNLSQLFALPHAPKRR